MVTKKEMLEIANNGNWEYADGEDRCIKCGRYDFEGKHEDYCSLGALLLLIEKETGK